MISTMTKVIRVVVLLVSWVRSRRGTWLAALSVVDGDG